MEMLLILRPEHKRRFEENRIVQGADFDDHPTGCFGGTGSNMYPTFTAELARRAIRACEAERLALCVAKGDGFDSHKKIPAATGDFLAGSAETDRSHRDLSVDLKSQCSAVA